MADKQQKFATAKADSKQARKSAEVNLDRVPQDQRAAAIVQRAFASSQPSPSTPSDVLTLQRAVGNRAITRLLTQPARSNSTLPIQAKLTVGSANDQYEQEADRIAAQVVDQIGASPSQASDLGGGVQRQQPEEDEELKRKPLTESIQREATAADGMQVSSGIESAIQSARGSGQPLAANVRTKMESAFGADFGGVKVHVDQQADGLNRSVQARAFTTGQDIFFRHGEYNPSSKEGQQLIAHELTHVVHQASTTTPTLQRATGFEYEVSVPVLKKDGEIPGDAPDDHDDTYDFVTRTGVKEKSLIEDKGYTTGKFKVVTDHGEVTGAVQEFQGYYKNDDFVKDRVNAVLKSEDEEPAKVEYVTAALNESDPDYTRLYTEQLQEVMESIKKLQQADPAHNELSIGNYWLGIPDNLRPPIVNGVEQDTDWDLKVFKLRKAIHFNAYMQATAGIDITKIPDLLTANTEKEFIEHPTHRLILQELPGHVGNVMGHISETKQLTEPDRKALEGFITLIIQYLLGYAYWKTTINPGGTNKNMAPLWIKANLSEVREKLPGKATPFLLGKRQLIYKLLLAESKTITQRISHQQTARQLKPEEQPFTTPEFSLNPPELDFIFGVLFEAYDKISEGETIGPYTLPSGATAIPLEFRTLQAHPDYPELLKSSLSVVNKVRTTHGQSVVDNSRIEKLLPLALAEAAKQLSMSVREVIDRLSQPQTQDSTKRVIDYHLEQLALKNAV